MGTRGRSECASESMLAKRGETREEVEAEVRFEGEAKGRRKHTQCGMTAYDGSGRGG